MGTVFSINPDEEAKRAAEAQAQLETNAAIKTQLPSLPRHNNPLGSSDLDYDYVMKLILVGEGCGGKSALITRFIDDTFEDDNCPTIGISFKIKTVVHRGRTVRLQLWDSGTHGEE
jgi:hypothetical protein